METETTTRATIARNFASNFKRKSRDNGEKFTYLDNEPQWQKDAVHTAHGDMFPDDFVYQTASAVVEAIAEALEYDADADLDDDRAEIVDGLVDIYTHDLTTWLNSNLTRLSYCDEAAEEFGDPTASVDLDRRIALGQYFEIDQIYGAILDALNTQFEELES